MPLRISLPWGVTLRRSFMVKMNSAAMGVSGGAPPVRRSGGVGCTKAGRKCKAAKPLVD